MGFLKPDSGEVTVGGLNSWNDSADINKQIGYIPGEIAFPDVSPYV
jgi:ABC-2 type transport system ATP-binding protein